MCEVVNFSGLSNWRKLKSWLWSAALHIPCKPKVDLVQSAKKAKMIWKKSNHQKRHVKHAENEPPVCHPHWRTPPPEASSDAEPVQTIPVMLNGSAICENPSVYLFLTEKDKRKKVKKCWTNRLLSLLSPWRHHTPYVWVLCSLSRAARWMMGKQADFPDPAQPRGTGGVCTAARRNTGNRGNSISASCARVPTPPPPHRTRRSLNAKGSTAYLSWLNEDGGRCRTLNSGNPLNKGNGSVDDAVDGCAPLNMPVETTFTPRFFIAFGSMS